MSILQQHLAALRFLAQQGAVAAVSNEFSFVFRDGDAAKSFAVSAARAGLHVEFAERLRVAGRWDVVASAPASLDHDAVARLGVELERLARRHDGEALNRRAAA